MTTIIDLIEQRGWQPTTTVHQARLMIFQPTRRPVALEQTFETSWGRVRVKGRLGQQHADLLEAILHHGQRPRDLGDGRIKLLVDPHEVSKTTRLEGSTLQRTLEDLLQSIVEIMKPAALAGIGHLIDHVDFARRADGEYLIARNPLGGERKLWRVDLGKAMCRLLQADLWQRRDPAPISRLRHGISQAVARHVLSHKAGSCDRWPVDTLIRAVAGDLDSIVMRHRRRELKEDAEALAELLAELGVQQKPGGVQQKPGGVQQKPSACSKNPVLSDLSGSSEA